jgi:hypothetical protein
MRNGNVLGVVISKALAEQMYDAMMGALAECGVKVSDERLRVALAKHLRRVGEAAESEAGHGGGDPAFPSG